MSTTELKLSFPTEKLEALRFFMDKKELTIEQELQNYLDKTMKRRFRPKYGNMWRVAWSRLPHRRKHRRPPQPENALRLRTAARVNRLPQSRRQPPISPTHLRRTLCRKRRA